MGHRLQLGQLLHQDVFRFGKHHVSGRPWATMPKNLHCLWTHFVLQGHQRACCGWRSACSPLRPAPSNHLGEDVGPRSLPVLVAVTRLY